MVKKLLNNCGLGTLSLPLAMIALVISLINLHNGKLGTYIFEKFPYGLISLILLIISYLLGKKYYYHTFAKIGKNISIFSLIFFIVMIVVSIFVAFF